MLVVRKIWRITKIAGWFTIPGLIAVPGVFRGREGIRANSCVARIWAWGITRILKIDIELEGDPKSFSGGMIVSNHLGYLDILCEGAVFPIRFAPKVEIRSWPILGWYLSLSRPIWVDRRSKQKSAEIAEEIERTLHENISTLIYPEGTSTDGKNGLLPFKSTPFEAIVRGRKPFLPILIKYDVPEDGQELAWYGDMTMWPHVWHLLGQPRLKAKIKILPEMEPLEGEDRKALAERVHKVMDEEFRRMK